VIDFETTEIAWIMGISIIVENPQFGMILVGCKRLEKCSNFAPFPGMLASFSRIVADASPYSP
jgi:hypothetical protein